MLKFFQTKVSAKIALGYIILLILMAGISLLSSARLREIDATVGNLTQKLSREKDLSAEISLHILSVRYYANRYLTGQKQEDLDLFNNQYARLKNVIQEIETLSSDPERSGIIAAIAQDVTTYGEVFSQAAALIRAEQKVISEVLDTQSLLLDNNFSALRVHIISLYEPEAFLAFGTAQTSYQNLHLNTLEYLHRSDERYTVLADKNYSTALLALTGLKASLTDPLQQNNVTAAQKALQAYYEGFRDIAAAEAQLRHLLNTELNLLEPKISEEAAQINRSINAEFARYNQQSRDLVNLTQTGLFFTTLASILGGGLLAFSLSAYITHPLQQVQQASHQLAFTDIRAFTAQMASLAKGDVRLSLKISTQPLAVPLKDEIGHTAQSFNEIVATLYEAETAFREMAAYLNGMAGTAQKIGLGNLELEIKPRSADDVLGHALLVMRDDLRAAQKQVEDTRDHLEDLVTKRTLELMEAKNLAENATRSKSIFLTNMSHELRTPLNAILGFAQLMARDPNLLPDQRENLETIERSGEHLLALINDVLEMSKIEAGRQALHLTSFDLYAFLDSLESMFKLRAREKNIQLRFSVDLQTPGMVRADQGKLRQVLINLLSNAIKFTDQGSVTLRLHPQSETSHTRQILLGFEIEDSGPGIAQTELKNLFTPFTQTSAGQRAQEGTGLGLAISYQFVNLMGGQIKVTSSVGAGSRFSFAIPVESVSGNEAEPNPATASARRVVGLAPGQPTFRILVVEDKEPNRQLMVKLLAPLGFEVREAANGLEALQIWAQWQPHLIWMDIRMPVMDGHEATRRIKATELGQKTIIIALTASAFEEERNRVLADGCDDFVRKPFRESELFEQMGKYLEIKYVYAEAPHLHPQVPEAAQKMTDLHQLRQAVQALDPGLLAQLNLAAAQADSEKILELLAGLDDTNPSLAEALTDYIQNFRLDLFIALVKPSEKE